MSTSQPPKGSIQADIVKLTRPVDAWLDLRRSMLVVEMADGKRIEVKLTPEEFERSRAKGHRVYDSERSE